LARRDPPHACTQITSLRPGTGLLCDGLRVIDIDIDDPAIARQICDFLGQFGPAPYRFRQNSARRVYLYRADHGEPSKTALVNPLTQQRIDVLGKGCQVFAYGTHPGSGHILQWHDGPEVTRRDDLAALADTDVQAILDFAAPLIAADPILVRSFTLPMPILVGDEWPIGDIVAALDVIPNVGTNWDFWFRIGAAVFAASGGTPDGFAAFVAWSCRARPRSNTADRLWLGLHRNPTRITAGTLLWHARNHDSTWDRPSRAGFTPYKRMFK
jgi:hypothetical protein